MNLVKIFILVIASAIANVLNMRVAKMSPDTRESIKERQLIQQRDILQARENQIRNYTKREDPQTLHVWKNLLKEEVIRRSGRLESYQSNKTGNSTESFSSLLSVNAIPNLDDPIYFFGHNDYEKNINLIVKNAQSGEPWSGSYWPMRYGLISARFDKNEFSTIGVWDPVAFNYTRYFNYTESASKYKQPDEYNKMVLQAANIQEYVNARMSPSEKYDILVGDTKFTLTNWMRWKGDQYTVKGDLPEWYGICHGWTAASWNYKRPNRTITLVAADGRTRVSFFPDEIKGLISLFFSNADFTTRFVGRTCPYNDPKKIATDNDTGLYTDEQCTSINPGAFVLILNHQMGVKKLNFAIDPNPDGEIWNQPIKNYALTYFHPISGNVTIEIIDSKISIESIKLSKDKFLKYVYKKALLDPLVKKIIGVYIDITYSIETEPLRSSDQMDNFFENELFVAILFLDSDDNIIGGEWKYNYHPNFAWKPDEETPPTGIKDASTPTFNGSSASLRRMTQFAFDSSQYGQPLKNIVEFLIKLSASSSTPTTSLITIPTTLNNTTNTSRTTG